MNHGGCVWGTDNPSEWLDFSANLRPEGPAEWAAEAFRRSLDNIRYYPDPEMKRARKGIALFLGVPEECVLPAAGGAAAIDLAVQASGGCVYTLPPTFGEYSARAAVHGRKTAVWQGTCEPGDMLMICNPNNPTGEVRTREELTALLAEVKAGGGCLAVDEAFIEYCPEYSLRGGICPGLIILGSFSKMFGIPGVRLGYICAVPAIIERLRQKILPWTLDAAATEIAAALPGHREQIAADRELNRERRELFREQLQGLGAEVYPSQGNFLLADFHRDMGKAAEALKARKILVRTCSSFGLPASFWRLAVKTEGENTRFIAALEEILHVR
ncbi:MAG: histidinol-phosphate aminotransferase family protein [Clostridia bacterium]|nr:histidinol-phosphate aminotransferase family protein [Clostridia bacterium]